MKQFDVPVIYRSRLISAVKQKRKSEDKLKKDFSPTLLDLGPLQVYLARHFGFCYGVENAIDIAFRTIDENPGRRIFLLSEMIHNPQVNADLEARGVKFLQDTYGRQIIPFDELQAGDIVLIPAFGTTVTIENLLKSKGIQIESYNTTCPFVERVWNKSEQIARKGFTVVIHGKPKHEETRATFSHVSQHTKAVIVNDLKDAETLATFIRGEVDSALFYEQFAGRFTEGFDVRRDLVRIGVVNQTTQLATETQAIAEHLKNVMINKYQGDAAGHFAETRDTLCYATNDNQTAVTGMLDIAADFAIIIGGYNSSNTSHLVELCEQKLPSYFINDADKLVSERELVHCNWHTKQVSTVYEYMPAKTPVKILVTSGASCPDALVEQVVRKLASFFNVSGKVDEIIEEFASTAAEA